jgi:hypothetical protein
MRHSYDANLGHTKENEMSSQRTGWGLASVIATALLITVGMRPADAQSTFATLTGTVTDQSGAVLPGTTVTVTNITTGVERTTTTAGTGEYQVPNLDAGPYLLRVQLSGFADSTREVVLLARQIVRVDLQMQVAGAAEKVEVTAFSPVIETERATIDTSRSGEDIAKLALNFRATNKTSPIVVATLSQGVQQDRNGDISVAGALPFMTSFSVDGISSQRVRFGGPSKELFPSVESIEEFKVASASNSAEFMQVTDLTTTTRSGTNRFHGTGFWFNQNSALSSTSQFTPRNANGDAIKPEISANSFGVSGGGPVARNRAFFFGTYEGVRRPNEVTLNQTVPPDAWRAGNLSSVAAAIRNPFTGGSYAGNQIPVNAVSARLLESFYARQNQPTGAAINAPNFIVNAPGDYTVNGFDGRFDFVPAANQKVFARFTMKNVDDLSPTNNDWNTTQGDHFRRTEVRQLAGSHSWIRGAFINETRGGWSNTVEKDQYTNASQGAGLIADAGLIGLPGAPLTGGFPHIEFGDGSFISTGGVKPFDILSRVVQGSNTSTWLAGRHTLKAGLDVQYVEYIDQISFFDGEELGRYVFDGTFTGHAFADFLLGMPHFTGYILPAPDVNPYSTYYAFFAQDSWRPVRNVTVDLGLRYDLRPPMRDRSNQLGNFDPEFPGGRVIVSDEAGLALVPSFVRQSVPNTPFVTADEAGLPKTLRRTDKNNLSPRLGIAWRPTEDGRTVIRGGFGWYTVPLLGSVNYSMVATVTAAAVNFANNPAAPFVFPNISSAASAEGALPPGTLDFRRANQIDMRDPRTMQWSVTLERDLGWNTAARVSYVGSTTEDLIWSPDINQVQANTLGYDAVRSSRPFTDWNVVTTRANDPRSRYDALGLALTKRISDGLTFDASYTLSKHKSDAGGTAPTTFAAENGATTADFFRGDADYGNVAFTRRHRFVSTFLFELPFGRGRQFASGIGRGLDVLVGGWDLTGITLLQSGPFLTPFFSNADPSGTGANVRGFTATQRPDQLSDGHVDNPTVGAYFNRAAFAVPGNNIGRFGNAEVGSLVGPGTKVFSMTVGKAFATGGTSRVRFEMAFSNLFNLENLDIPNTNVTSSAFGRITDTQVVDQAGPRTVQFSLRYSF